MFVKRDQTVLSDLLTNKANRKYVKWTVNDGPDDIANRKCFVHARDHVCGIQFPTI